MEGNDQKAGIGETARTAEHASIFRFKGLTKCSAHGLTQNKTVSSHSVIEFLTPRVKTRF